MKIGNSIFEECLSFSLRLWAFVMPEHCQKILDGMPEWRRKLTPPQQYWGLFASISDAIVYSYDMTSGGVRDADRTLRAEGFMTLSEARLAYDFRLKRLLTRPVLKHEVEAIMLKNALDFGDLNDAEAERAEYLIDKFAS